jgi:hypothetical protein
MFKKEPTGFEHTRKTKGEIMKLLRCVGAILIFLGTNYLSAQIVIDWTEIPHTIGTTWTKNLKHDATVALGSPGGPQTWNFTAQPMGTENCHNVIVPKASTPFPDSFPNSNLVYSSFEDVDTSYLYMELTPNFLSTQGLCDSEIVMQYFPYDSIPLPVHYQDSHDYHYGYEVVEGDFTAKTEWYGHSTIDAYGTVTIPYGTYPCLRECSFDTCAMTTFYLGTPIFGDTITHISYTFIAEHYSGVVCVFSHADETNPNYTDAEVLERITNFSPGIEEYNTTPKNTFTCYPNPFSDYVELNYTLAQPSDCEVTIYDINGRLVKTLMSGQQQLGSYSVHWNGKNEAGDRLPNGVYVCRFKIDNAVVSQRKILLIQ